MNLFDLLAASTIKVWGLQASGLAAIILAVVVGIVIFVRMTGAPH